MGCDLAPEGHINQRQPAPSVLVNFLEDTAYAGAPCGAERLENAVAPSQDLTAYR